MSDGPAKPILLFDGDCGFCRRWIARWSAITGPRVEYAPYQEVGERYPQITRHQFESAVQLVSPDGSIHAGAEAVFRTLAVVPGQRWLLWLYLWMPWFGRIARLIYRFIARHRVGFSAITTLLWGQSVEPPTYQLSRRLFIRGMGLIYLIAFASLAVQVEGLIGSKGITPVAELLPRVEQHYGDAAFWKFPTLCWWDASDRFLNMQTWSGTLLAGLVILGAAPIPLLVGCWILYLSLTSAGQVFIQFQWDILLLEAGFLAIFLAPLSWRLASPQGAPPSRIARLLVVWLLFRLMIESGVVKLVAGAGEPAWLLGLAKRTGSWWDLTALTYHYQTQPIPSWTAWYAHHLPLWFQKFSVVLMFVAELFAPLLLFGTRRLRHAGCAMIVGLMAIIGATGNYNFFNLLTVVLCIPCLDDRLLSSFTPRRMRSWIVVPAPRERRRIGRLLLMVLVAAFILPISLAEGYSGIWRKPVTSPWFSKMLAAADPYRVVNAYGLFRDMTLTRPEIIIEGSLDGRTWIEYEFPWKPGDLRRPPGFCQPHQPRLDWQMWFAALSTHQRTPWFGRFLQRILEGSQPVLALMEKNPFPDAPPKFVRALLYDYRFTDLAVRTDSGAWWRRELIRVYTGPSSLPRK